MSIFISVAAYCDPVLSFTLERAVATAHRPGELHFAVVDQTPPEQAQPMEARLPGIRLSYVRIDPVHARGPCWARALAMSYYEGEDWFFQIDSHMDFDPGWDERLIDQARSLLQGRDGREGGHGVVLGSYPNAFVFQEGHPVRRPGTNKVLAHVVKPGSRFDPQHLVLAFEGQPTDSDRPLPGFHVAAGCLFAPGAFATTFPYDPAFYFHGEEQALSLRLYTHGWDVFHVPALPVCHLYNNGATGVAPRPLHWDAAQEAGRSQSWWALEQRSRQRLTDLVAGNDLGVYGLGRERTIADYAAFSGIDYAARTLAPRAFLSAREAA